MTSPSPQIFPGERTVTQQRTRTFTKLQDNFVKMEVGQTVEGTLIKSDNQKFAAKRGQTEGSDVGRYTLRSDDGKEYTILGATHLDTLMEQVTLNTYVRITYVGVEPTSGGNKVKKYSVEVAN